jgi:hypothetical protein
VRRPRSPAALAIRTDPRDVVEERLDDPPLFLDRFLIGEEDAIADERRVEELFVPVPAAWSVTTIAFIVRLPVSSSCLLTDRSRPRRRLTDANEHASPSPSATAHERTEYLRSQAGATGGNQWQMGAPENRSNKPIRNPWQPTATHGNRFAAHGKEGVDGSSPSEGSAKAAHVGAFPCSSTCSASSVRWVWNRLWSFRAREAGRERRTRSCLCTHGCCGFTLSSSRRRWAPGSSSGEAGRGR